MWRYHRVNNDELYHFGILGMKWGVRRYQNEDGSLTDAGRKRYGVQAQRVENDTDFVKNVIANGAKDYKTPDEKLTALSKDYRTLVADYHKYMTAPPQVKQRIDRAADLGLQALAKEGMRDVQWPSDDLDFDREWFLFEDQTFGMDTVADMIANRGYSAKECKKMIDIVEKALDEKPTLWMDYDLAFDVDQGNYNGELKKFADACEKVKRGKKK